MYFPFHCSKAEGLWLLQELGCALHRARYQGCPKSLKCLWSPCVWHRLLLWPWPDLLTPYSQVSSTPQLPDCNSQGCLSVSRIPNRQTSELFRLKTLKGQSPSTVAFFLLHVWHNLQSLSRYLLGISACFKQKRWGKSGAFIEKYFHKLLISEGQSCSNMTVFSLHYSLTLSNVLLAAYMCKWTTERA